MKNKYMLLLPLIVFLSASAIFLTSKPVVNDALDPAKCNCSGPKASQSKSINN